MEMTAVIISRAAVFYSHIFGVSLVGLGLNPLVSGLNLHLTVPAAFLEETAWETVSAYTVSAQEVTTVMLDPANHVANTTTGTSYPTAAHTDTS